MTTPDLYAVILAGGSGTRFWPASRKKQPKQFLAVGGKRSLIAETAARLGKLVPPERRLVIAGEEHVTLVRKALRNLPPENILAEPIGRNTAPCVAWAALEIERRSPGAVHAIFPADHVIGPAARFRKTLQAAAEEARTSGALVTFGIRPTFPATGYGYIEQKNAVGKHGSLTVYAVERFVEKPDRARAEQFLSAGRFLWNSGIFVWTTTAILTEMRRSVPDLMRAMESVRDNAGIVRIYPTLPSVSVDVAVLEKALSVRVIPADFTWSDVGAWPALPETLPLDDHGNCVAGGATLLAEEARNCVAYGKRGELIALLGVEDMIVVRAGNALLVCKKDRAQDVKKIVTRLEREGPAYL
ncbi:MAG: mannose-1-phosphate guanylyltransferase [Planctomycetes bacterium]|nr:mannose-1-phosphate guanylyltransferase [Planctomycetota bacterium]